jgi:hypothetical protein
MDSSPIPDDGEAHGDIYNAQLKCLAENGKNSWFKSPWLFAECVKSPFRPFFILTPPAGTALDATCP